MKPYFAKLVPVEGEIKEGDKVLFEGKILTVNEFTHDDTVCFEEEVEQEIPENAFLRTAKKVKLFLCSRDIEFHDDNLFHADGSSITQDEKNKYGRNEILVWRSAGCYKVIGEISPEATWVKEGDEFDKDQTQYAIYKPKENGTNMVCTLNISVDWEEAGVTLASNGWYKCIRIKGPCGYFH